MTANYEQPDAMNKRVRFYDGQFLQDQDFVDEQKYYLDRRQRLTRLLHVAGIANGLEVRSTNQPFQVRVTAGTAVDLAGRLLVLTEYKTILDNDGRALLANASEPVSLPAEAASGERWLYVAYHQMADDLQASGDGVEGETRWHEAPYLFTAVAPLGEDDTYDGPLWHDFLVDGPPAPVLLGRVTLDADGAVTVDNSVRRYSGLRLPGLRAGNQAAGLRAEGDGRVGLWSLKDGDLTEHLSVTEKGYVGVGTSVPNAALEIRTELRATVQNRALVGLHISPNFNANNISGVREYGLLVERGSVGIGTAAPNAKLEVVGGGGSSIDLVVNGRIRSDNNDGGLWVSSDRFVGGHDVNKIGFWNNGAWRLTVRNNGNVGIGITTPGEMLHVSGGNIRIEGSQKLFFSDIDTSNNLKVQLWSGYGLGINGGTLFYAANGKHSWRDNAGTNERMSLTTSADGGLTISGTGNSSFAGGLGIGITSPPDKLTVDSGDIRIQGGRYRRLKVISDNYWAGIELVAREVSEAGNPHIDFTHGDLDSPNFGVRLYAPDNDKFIIDGGDVGIGTNPIQTLDVNGRIHVNNGVIQRGGSAITTTNDLGLYSQLSGHWMRLVTTDAPIRFYTDGGIGTTAHLSVQSNGNVGIGTINPAMRLHIVQSSINSGIRLDEIGTNGVLTGRYFRIAYEGQGNIHFYHQSTLGQWMNPAGHWNHNSDVSLKENISSLSNVLDKVMQLRPVRFNWRSNQVEDMGFVAQDVEKVLPEIVNSITIDGKSIKGLPYTTFGVLAIGALQELKAYYDQRLSTLEEKIESLSTS